MHNTVYAQWKVCCTGVKISLESLPLLILIGFLRNSIHLTNYTLIILNPLMYHVRLSYLGKGHEMC